MKKVKIKYFSLLSLSLSFPLSSLLLCLFSTREWGWCRERKERKREKSEKRKQTKNHFTLILSYDYMIGQVIVPLSTQSKLLCNNAEGKESNKRIKKRKIKTFFLSPPSHSSSSFPMYYDSILQEMSTMWVKAEKESVVNVFSFVSFFSFSFLSSSTSFAQR